MYIIARMILGFGIVFCIVSGSAMLGELVSRKSRKLEILLEYNIIGVKITWDICA